MKTPIFKSFFIAVPRPDVIVIANIRSIMEEMLRKVARPDERAFPPEAREWQFITPGRNVWGLRRFSAEIGKTDISDARFPEDGIVAQADSFTFEIDSQKGRSKSVWLSCDQEMHARLRNSIHHRVRAPEDSVAATAAGTVTIRIDWKKSSPLRKSFAVWLTWYTGHAAVV